VYGGRKLFLNILLRVKTTQKQRLKQPQKKYSLSELFNTSYTTNGGGDRVYHWGYLAVRFKMENHRYKVEKSLTLSRKGDWDGYQALMTSWSTSLDEQWFI